MVMPSCADLLSGFALVMLHCARKERATRITSCTSRKSLSSSAKCQCACENGKDREVRKRTHQLKSTDSVVKSLLITLGQFSVLD